MVSIRQNSTGLETVRNILGVDVSVLSTSAAVNQISKLIIESIHTKILFLNAYGANQAWQDEEFRHTLKQFVTLPDGLGVDLCSFINYGEKFPDNLNGTDFIPHLLGQLKSSCSVALLGAQPGVADLARDTFQTQFPNHQFRVISHGYFAPEMETTILAQLKSLKPDILLVALGNPVQEKWIINNCHSDNCTLVFGVGALFDFTAGRVPRAPSYIRRFRLEWLYRLWKEPRRLWMRYVVGNPAFIMRSIIQKLRT